MKGLMIVLCVIALAGCAGLGKLTGGLTDAGTGSVPMGALELGAVRVIPAGTDVAFVGKTPAGGLMANVMLDLDKLTPSTATTLAKAIAGSGTLSAWLMLNASPGVAPAAPVIVAPAASAK